MSAYTPEKPPKTLPNLYELQIPQTISLQPLHPSRKDLNAVFWVAVFLIVVPVFIEAPLVRAFPSIGLSATLIWFALSVGLLQQARTRLWGDLFLGFTWIWLAGATYWGWLRWEPLLHLPVESMGLPIALSCLFQNRWKVGSYFYLGSLLGTAVTDIYFYWVDLIPFWRQLMTTSPDLSQTVLQEALGQVHTPWGGSCAAILLLFLVIAGSWPLCSKTLHWWAFGGAVLSTILVDGLFYVTAAVA